MRSTRARAVALRLLLALLAPAAGTAARAEAELPAPGTAFRDCEHCPLMVVVPPGQYMMGPPPTSFGRFHHEGFLREIRIAQPFALGKYEVTFDEWEACVRAGACDAADDAQMGRGRRPVVNVSWEQANAYTRWLAQTTGKAYRLPSEPEWEYAGRAGGALTRFLGVAPERVCEYANVYDRSGRQAHAYEWEHVECDDRHAGPAPVGTYRPNAFGLHDMVGNVWEWTQDCLNPSWRVEGGDGSPWLYGDCQQRAFRGGSWLEHEPVFLLPGNRYKYIRSRQNDLGFRVARPLP